MLFDLLHDLKRLSCFHEIKRPNFLKIIAYTASWWIRRKPYQIIEDDNDLIFINEQFALSLIFFATKLKNKKNQIIKENAQKLKDGVNKIFYHLKYRNTNPQTLELFIIGTELGSMVLE